MKFKVFILILFIGLISLSTVSAEEILVDDSNFDSYFSDVGTSGLSDGDFVRFTGDISYKMVTVDKNLSISSNEGVSLREVSLNFNENAKGSTVSNLSFSNSIAAISVVSSDVTVSGNFISLDSSSGGSVVGVSLNGDNIVFVDNFVEVSGIGRTLAVDVVSCDDFVFGGNSIVLRPLEAPVYWREDVGFYENVGLQIQDSSKVSIFNNSFSAVSSGFNGNFSTLLNVRVLESSDVSFVSNFVNSSGYRYVYGLVSDYSDILVRDCVFVSSSFYYGNCILLHKSICEVFNNSFSVFADYVSYPVYVEFSNGSTISSNLIVSSAPFVYGVEIYSACGNLFSFNVLNLSGEYTMGFGLAGGSVSNSIVSNSVLASGVLDGEVRCGDRILAENTGVKLVGDCLDTKIFYNNISTGGLYSLNLGNISRYSLDGNILNARYVSGSDSIYPSFIKYFNTSLVFDIFMEFSSSGGDFKGKLFDSDGNVLAGQHVYLTLIRLSSGANKTYDITTDLNGEFVFPIRLSTGLYGVVGEYKSVKINNNVYLDTRSSGSFVISSSPNETVISLNDYIEPYQGDGWNKDLVGSLTYLNGSSIIGRHLSLTLTRISSGASKTYDTVSDYKGEFSLKIRLAPGEYRVDCSFTDNGFISSYKTVSMVITR